MDLQTQYFLWKTPKLSKQQKSLLCDGYLGEISVQKAIPKDVLNMCISYCSLDGDVTLNDIRNIKSYGLIEGPRFQLFNCIWRLMIFRDKDSVIQFGLSLLNIMPALSEIRCEATMIYFNGLYKDKNKKQKMIKHETSIWKFNESNRLKKWKSKSDHSQFIKFPQFEFKLKLKLLSMMDTTKKLTSSEWDKSWQYLMMSSFTNKLSSDIMNKLDDIEQRLDKHEAILNQLMDQKKRKEFDVKEWLNSINESYSDQYYDIFLQNGLDDLQSIQLINDINLLKDIGINKVGHRMTLMHHIKLIQNSL